MANLEPKFDQLWILTKIEWRKVNPPNLGEVYYQCALCPEAVHMDEMTLDHIHPRATYPHLKYSLENLQPCHFICNTRKGSMTMEHYFEAFPQFAPVAA
jgi:5-methylcytosine-specific restriction endonuclease McrA